jgi:putative hydrolase of HD superfamily
MKELLKFVEFTSKFREVKRMIKFSDGTNENDAEHSLQLALVAWYVVSSNNLDLDINLILKYSIAHDLVEIYAGDTPAPVHKEFDKERETKAKREEEAALRIRGEFAEFEELHQIIEEYERKDSREAKFVSALDKIMPLMNIYLDGGHSWKLHHISFEDSVNSRRDKIKESPEVEKYFKEIVEILRSKPDLFTPLD